MDEQTNIVELGPIYEPSPVAFGFETIGWKILATVLIILLAWSLFVLIRRYIKNAYRREATRMLANIELRFNTEKEVACINDAMVLLKQVSLKTYARSEVADLHGREWLTYLSEKSKHVDFLIHTEFVLSALYKNELKDLKEAQGFFNESKKWIKYHVA